MAFTLIDNKSLFILKILSANLFHTRNLSKIYFPSTSKKMKKIFENPTPFFLLGSLALILLSLFFLLILFSGKFHPVIVSKALILLYPIVFLLIFIALDRSLIKKISIESINLIEFIILVVGFIIFLIISTLK